MDWLGRYRARRQQASEARLAERLQAWLQASRSIHRQCGASIDDRLAGEGDIGRSLDRIDRELHLLKDTASALATPLRRRDPELARQAGEITESLYRLRNQTASYLIRAQGPAPAFLTNPRAGEGLQGEHRRKAFEQVGAEARQLALRTGEQLTLLERQAEPFLRLPPSPRPPAR